MGNWTLYLISIYIYYFKMSYTSIIKQNNNNKSSSNPDDSAMTNSINHMMNNSYTYNYNPKYRVTRLPNPPSFLQHGSLQFVIMDAPTDDNLRTYIKELHQKSVRCVVRTCEPTYSEEPLIAAKMNVKDLPFPDGHPPSDDIIAQWLEVVNDKKLSSSSTSRRSLCCWVGSCSCLSRDCTDWDFKYWPAKSHSFDSEYSERRNQSETVSIFEGICQKIKASLL